MISVPLLLEHISKQTFHTISTHPELCLKKAPLQRVYKYAQTDIRTDVQTDRCTIDRFQLLEKIIGQVRRLDICMYIWFMHTISNIMILHFRNVQRNYRVRRTILRITTMKILKRTTTGQRPMIRWGPVDCRDPSCRIRCLYTN